MRIAALVLVVAACGGSTRESGPVAPTSKLALRLREAGLARLVDATRARDPVKVRAMLDHQVTFGGAWFEDALCRGQLATVGTISGGNLDPLARCISTLPLGASTRQSAHPEIALVTYAPGIELELLFGGTVEDPKLRWIGYVSRAATGDALPTVSQSALEALRIDPQPFVLDDATRAAASAEAGKFDTLFSWFKVCVDAQGAITGLHLRETSSLAALRAHEQALRAWRLRPFMIRTQPTPVCSLVHIGELPRDRDSAAAPPLLPIARPDALQVSPWVVETRLIDSDLRVMPDESDRPPKRSSFAGIYGVCFTPAGTVESTVILRPTGLPGYDRKILERLRTWRYRALERDGAPVATCTRVTAVLQVH